MSNNTKISIRFFDDKEVRAVWDEENAKWYFSVVYIVGILNEENELVSATTQLKLKSPDGKKRFTDTLDSNGIIALAKHFPNNRAMKFLDWFLYSDNTIDGQSKKKTYAQS